MLSDQEIKLQCIENSCGKSTYWSVYILKLPQMVNPQKKYLYHKLDIFPLLAESSMSIIEFLEISKTVPVMDVRSPAEFEHGHIPGALNLPLFTNEERSIVGTLYLQKGSSEAMMKGLELIGPKMKEFAEFAMNVAPNKEVLVHCWRGGMRSNSMCWLLNTIGIKSSTLEGGYKNYRRYVHEFFARPLHFILIGGMTGSGKTEVLKTLELLGKQVIDLEKLARHKGSVFGGVEMLSQPTTEQFENDLFTCLRQINPSEPIFLEDESLAIGQIFIPQPFFKQMSASRSINLQVPFSKRVQYLVKTYTSTDVEFLVSAVRRIEKRLGLAKTAEVIKFIYNNEMKQAIEIVLRYYDKVYNRSMDLAKRKEIQEIFTMEKNFDEIALEIVRISNDWKF
jgi:tRNA 2-selenouridine synthase